VQLSKAADVADQNEVAMMKGVNEPIGDMQKVDNQDSCNKPACKSCNECTPPSHAISAANASQRHVSIQSHAINVSQSPAKNAIQSHAINASQSMRKMRSKAMQQMRAKRYV